MARKKYISESLLFHLKVANIASDKKLTWQRAYDYVEALQLVRTGRRMYSNYSSFATSKSYLSKKYRHAFKINS